ETLEDMWLVAQRDTDAIVVHANSGSTAIATNINSHFDARLAAMPEGILQQIVNCLFYSETVGFNPRKMLRHIDCHRCTALANSRIQAFQGSVHGFDKIHRLEMETDFPGLQLGNRQKIFDQEIQALGMLVHRL